MDARVNYSLNLQAEPGWNNTYTFTLPASMNRPYTNGKPEGSQVTTWEVENGNGEHPSTLAKLEIQLDGPTTPTAEFEDIRLEFELDTRTVKATSLTTNILANHIDISGYNVVVHPGVSGRVTLKLLNVPWDQALEIILGIFSLEAKFEGNIMTIAPSSVFDKIARDREQRKTTKTVTAELVRRVFHLKYIPADEMKSILDEEKVMSARGRTRIDANLDRGEPAWISKRAASSGHRRRSSGVWFAISAAWAGSRASATWRSSARAPA